MSERREPQDEDAEVVQGEVVEGELVPAVEDPTPAPLPEVGYTSAGVPTFDYVRERIEGRVATAGGAGELDAATPEVRSLEQQEAERAAAGRDKLEEIRRSLRGEA
jgi:hypothetical protein